MDGECSRTSRTGIGEIADALRRSATAIARNESDALPIPCAPLAAIVEWSTSHYREVHTMEPIIDRATGMARTQLTKMRWALGLNGLLSIVVGVVILVWPSISLLALTILFGAYALATGVVGIVAAVRGAGGGERAWLVFSSLLGIVVGIVVLVWPDISELALLYVIGVYAFALGILGILAAFYLPLDGEDTVLMVLLGIVSVLFGIAMFAEPNGGALVVLALIAAFALVTGVTEVIVAVGARRILANSLKRSLSPAEPHPST